MHRIDPYSGDPNPTRPMPLPEKKAWYDLDRYSRYRDLFSFIGLCLITYGFSMLSLPISLIVGGSFMLVLGWLMSR